MERRVPVLVTGGAGYIGSTVVSELIRAGDSVVVFDNLQQGHRGARCLRVRRVHAHQERPQAPRISRGRSVQHARPRVPDLQRGHGVGGEDGLGAAVGAADLLLAGVVPDRHVMPAVGVVRLEHE